jgi:tetratricopeptide (TPR) repeat protein
VGPAPTATGPDLWMAPMIKSKLPAALFLVAGLIVGVTLVRDDDAPARTAEAALPDPATMRANGYGYDPLEETVALWRRRVQDDPNDYLSRTQLGRSLIGLAKETGDLVLYERAERQLTLAAEAAPGDISAQTGLASSLAAQHEFDAALEVLAQARQVRPDDLGIQAAIADAHLDLGDYDTAFDLLDEVAASHPGTVPTISRQARTAALTGDNQLAVDLARRALIGGSEIGLRPSEAAGLWFQYAFFQHQAGQLEGAESSLRSALEVDPRHLGSIELLGRVLVGQGRLDDAAALYEDLVARTPAADLHGSLAEVYEAQGRARAADRQLRLGLALAEEQVGQFPAERRHLAGFFADADPERFLQLMEEDVATRRDIGGLDLLAWARYLNGDLDGARAAIDEATALGTQDAPLLFHAGMIEAATGDEDRARDLLQSALDLNPGFDLGDVAEARATLADLSPG